MKKLLLLAGISVLLFFSCASTKIVFDESLPDDEIATINWYGMHVVEYNGITVDWKLGGGGLLIKIPGGSAQFVLNGTIGSINMGYYTYDNIPFNYNFENGKEYTVQVFWGNISVYSGKSYSKKDRIASYNMSSGQQVLVE
jgi:opacity protein-like surface antigen